ncbi:MAG: hypothetical protein EOM85_04330 [Candidatus Moranbacteria bacterium]|nr:hypothetical protein [Candidatus Moranbacteria bacterium]
MRNLKKKYILITFGIFLLFVAGVSYIFYNIQEKKSDTTSSESVSAWDAETASFKKYASYSEMEEERESEKRIDLEEYNRAIKGTVVEQIQNIEIPSYDSDERLFRLEDGKIEVRSMSPMSPMKDDLSKYALLWSASLEKNLRSFTVADFNNDGLEDVAHIIGYTGGGSGYFYYLNIFINEQGKLKYLTQRELEDRIIIKGLKYSAGDFLLDVIAHGEGEDFLGYCCPNVPKTLKFQLQDNKLIEK